MTNFQLVFFYSLKSKHVKETHGQELLSRMFQRVMNSVRIFSRECLVTNFTGINEVACKVHCLQVVFHFGRSFGEEFLTKGTEVVFSFWIKLYIKIKIRRIMAGSCKNTFSFISGNIIFIMSGSAITLALQLSNKLVLFWNVLWIGEPQVRFFP